MKNKYPIQAYPVRFIVEGQQELPVLNVEVSTLQTDKGVEFVVGSTVIAYLDSATKKLHLVECGGLLDQDILHREGCGNFVHIVWDNN